jgi:protein-S-isoprenylcysteine O-methyltransferase Ste14
LKTIDWRYTTFGAAAVTGTAPFYLATFGYGVVMDRVFCPYEEQKALVEFGDRYIAYRQSVRRWI